MGAAIADKLREIVARDFGKFQSMKSPTSLTIPMTLNSADIPDHSAKANLDCTHLLPRLEFPR